MAVYSICGNCGREIEQGSKCICGIDKERYKRYNKYVRWNKDNVLYSRFYSSAEWIRLSKYIRSKYNNMCLMCLLEEGKINVADVTHHIIPIRKDFGKRLQEDNLITLCHNHHNRIDHKHITEEYIKHMMELIRRYEEEF